MRKLKAHCLCGGIGMTVVDDFAYFGLCHCSQCRKMSGSAFSAFAGVPFDNLEFLYGEELVCRFEKSPGNVVAFCRRCGSSLFGEHAERRIYHVRAGILDDEPTQKPTASYYFGSRALWHDPDGKVQRHETLG